MRHFLGAFAATIVAVCSTSAMAYEIQQGDRPTESLTRAVSWDAAELTPGGDAPDGPRGTAAPRPSTSTSSPSPSSSTTSTPVSSTPLNHVDTQEKVVYLTFDDGPDARWTPQVADQLRRHGAKATFFTLGQNAASNPQLVKDLRRDGHAVANHTWDHPDLSKADSGTVRSQLDRTDRTLGGTAKCVRPPYGASNPTVRRQIADRGQHTVLWDVDTNDWKKPGADQIAQTAVAGAKPGAVILMHDGGGNREQTVSAVGQVLTRLGQQGYRFETLPMC